MKQKLLIAFTLSLTLLSACSSTPVKPPEFSLTAKDKVGVILDIPSHPSHKHLSLKAMKDGGFTKEYSLDWNIKDHLFSVLKKSIQEKTGADVILIDAKKVNIELVSQLLRYKNKAWSVNKTQQALYSHLINDLDLTAIIAINTPEKPVHDTGSGAVRASSSQFGLIGALIGEVSANISKKEGKGYGLLSITKKSKTTFSSFNTFETTALVLTPPYNPKNLGKLDALEKNRIQIITDLPQPVNEEDISDEQWMYVEQSLGKYIDMIATDVSAILVSEMK